MTMDKIQKILMMALQEIGQSRELMPNQGK
jgi:hypothetical protein